MAKFIFKRLIETVITLFLIVTVTFFLMRVAKGSPFQAERNVPPEILKTLEAKYALDKPLFQQYILYISNVARGDLGLSIKYPERTVNDMIVMALPKTLIIVAMAMVFALVIGLSAGIIGAIRQNTIWDFTAMSAAVLGISLPSFVLGPLLVLVFSLGLMWFPAAGWGGFRHLILPAITLGTLRASYIARLARAGLLEVLHSDFIRTAKAKGLSEAQVVFKHALKGGLIPVVTYLGPGIANAMVGSVVIEKIFNIPGIGSYFVDAAFNRDYFLMMGVVIVYSGVLLLMNLLVDIAYGLMDPRVRYDG